MIPRKYGTAFAVRIVRSAQPQRAGTLLSLSKGGKGGSHGKEWAHTDS
jgi:hypothetical protein